MAVRLAFNVLTALLLVACSSDREVTLPPEVLDIKEIESDSVSALFEKLSANPVDSDLHFSLGAYFYRADKYANFELSRAAFQSAIRHSPDEPRNHLGLAAVSYRLGDYNTAMLSYLRAISRQNQKDINYVHFSALALRAGYYDISMFVFNSIDEDKIADVDVNLYKFLKSTFSRKIYPTKRFANYKDRKTLQILSNQSTKDRTAYVDAVIVQHYVANRDEIGTNLLDNLGVVLTGDLINYTSNKTSLTSELSEVNRSLVASLPANLEYTLKIFSEEVSRTRIESNPNIIIKDGRSASLSSTESLQIVQSDPDAGTYLSDASDVTTGITLTLEQPAILDDGVDFDVVIQASSFSDSQDDSEASSLGAPSVRTSNVEVKTSVFVPYGQVVALGGLSYKFLSDRNRGVPELRKIPFFENIFGVKNKDYRRDDTVVLISARESAEVSSLDFASSIYKMFDQLFPKAKLVSPVSIGENPVNLPSIQADI